MAKLEFRVGNDDPAFRRAVSPGAVDLEADLPQLRGQLVAQMLSHVIKRDVLVMTGLGLGRR